MKGSPASIWLSWANRAAAIWTNTAMAVARQQQTAMLNAMKLKPASAKSKGKGGK